MSISDKSCMALFIIFAIISKLCILIGISFFLYNWGVKELPPGLAGWEAFMDYILLQVSSIIICFLSFLGLSDKTRKELLS